MKRTERLDLRVEPELYDLIVARARELSEASGESITISAAARDLLRQATTEVNNKDGGWKSGFSEGASAGFRAVVSCIGAVKNAVEAGASPESIAKRIEGGK